MTQQPYQPYPGQQPYQPALPTPGRPGQMTMAMQAVMRGGPKVLRIGVVKAGRVTEERVIKQRADVSVGASEKSTFAIGGANLPPQYKLFELVNNEYCLNFLEGMVGRVALPTGISDLSMLRGHARRTAYGAYQIRLTDDSRGKVVIGDTTFLFQFVIPPPIQPKPQLPVSVMRGTSGIDWPTTMIAAFSFMAHFMAIGSVYSDWLDPVIDDEVSVAGLVETVRSLPIPPPIEEVEAPTEDTSDAAQAEEAKPAGATAQASGSTGQTGGAGSMSSAQAAALSSELDQLEMATLGALAGDGPATAGVLRGGEEVPLSGLDSVAASGAGVGIGSGAGALRLGGGGGAIRPGSAGGGLGAIGSTGRGEGTGDSSGAVKVVQGPKGNASVGSAGGTGNVSNAARVVAGMSPGFRRCYNQELASNPDAAGSIRLTIRVGPGGEVQSVSPAASGNLGSTVGCVVARAQASQFAPPEGGAAVIQVPVTFVKQ